MIAVPVKAPNIPKRLIDGRMKPTAAATTKLREALEIRRLNEKLNLEIKTYMFAAVTSALCECRISTK